MHFITYGNHNFTRSKQRIIRESKEFGFETSKAYTPDDLDIDFSSKFKHVLEMPRIGGYGIWRPYIIKDALNKLKDNEILVYLDAGCTINNKGKDRFNHYIELVRDCQFGIISFQLNHLPEKWYTAEEIFSYFNISEDSLIRESGQYLDGILIMKKCDHVIKMIDLWLKSVYENVMMYTDIYNGNQKPYFRDNRHEQSVFSVIRKLYGSIVIPDETWFFHPDGGFGSERSLIYPFWATRIRG